MRRGVWGFEDSITTETTATTTFLPQAGNSMYKKSEKIEIENQRSRLQSWSEKPAQDRQSACFSGISGTKIQKNSSLSISQTAVNQVEVTGFEPATFWSRSVSPELHFIQESQNIRHNSPDMLI
jgi:hypothetical protein